jgi:hypothetical protein
MSRRRSIEGKWLSGALLAALLVAQVAVLPASNAETVSEDAVRAAYLYRFAGYVDWPTEIPVTDTFTIDVVDSPVTASELRRLLANHAIKDRSARVREIASLKDLQNAQMLYVGAGHADMIRGLGPRPGLTALLIVTNEDGGLATGSVINFVPVDRNIRFEVSMGAAQRWGLKVSSELLSVAVRVQAPLPRSASIRRHYREDGRLMGGGQTPSEGSTG